MLLRNIAAVVANYLDEGVRYFVLARAFQGRSELDSLIGELPMPLKLVRLTVPVEVIEE